MRRTRVITYLFWANSMRVCSGIGLAIGSTDSNPASNMKPRNSAGVRNLPLPMANK